MAIVFTYGFSTDARRGRQSARRHRRGPHARATRSTARPAWLTLFMRGMLCNWMVSTGVVGAMISTQVSGKVIAMWMPIMVFFSMTFEHSVVNMFLFPSALMHGRQFSIIDYFIWNEIPTVLGNLVGGLAFTGPDAVRTHVRTAPKRAAVSRLRLKQSAAASPADRRGSFVRQCPAAASLARPALRQGPQGANQDFHGACIPGEPLLGVEGHRRRAGRRHQQQRGEPGRERVRGQERSSRTTTARRRRGRSRSPAQRVLVATNSWLHAQTRRSQYRYDKDRGYVCTLQRDWSSKSAPRTSSTSATRASTACDGSALEQLTRTIASGSRDEQSYLEPRARLRRRRSRSTTTRCRSSGATCSCSRPTASTSMSSARVRSSRRSRDARGDLDAAARAIVAEAYERGSADNLTVQIVRVDDLPTRGARARSCEALPQLPFAAAASTPRMMFDGYRIVRELHASSRSHVYLAVDDARPRRRSSSRRRRSTCAATRPTSSAS